MHCGKYKKHRSQKVVAMVTYMYVLLLEILWLQELHMPHLLLYMLYGSCVVAGENLWLLIKHYRVLIDTCNPTVITV